jgi:hypothetical protein
LFIFSETRLDSHFFAGLQEFFSFSESGIELLFWVSINEFGLGFPVFWMNTGVWLGQSLSTVFMGFCSGGGVNMIWEIKRGLYRIVCG